MEWGDIPPLTTKTIRLEEGDLFVTAVNKYGLQTDNATLYSCVVLRPTSMSLASMRAHMEAACQFHNWCGALGIDFLQRLENGEFFLQHEMVGLRDELRRNLSYRPPKGDPPTSKRRKKTERPIVGNAHWRNRCSFVRDYVAWHAETVIKRVSARDERLPEMRARLASFKEEIVYGISVRHKPMREGLTEEEEKVFLAAITPGDPSNPFAVRNQVRNHALWLTYYDGGVRLGEGLGLKTTDCHLNGPSKKLVVHRRPDDPHDPRLRPALTKTLPHPVEVGARLVNVLHGFIVKNRPLYPGAKRSPYVFLSEDGGPLTHKTVAYMYEQLRTVPGMAANFSTNDARRAWNSRFAVAAKKVGLTEEKSLTVANLAQGRVPTSKQGERYRTRYNNQQTEQIMLRMQDEDVGANRQEKE
jgi:integrase